MIWRWFGVGLGVVSSHGGLMHNSFFGSISGHVHRPAHHSSGRLPDPKPDPTRPLQTIPPDPTRPYHTPTRHHQSQPDPNIPNHALQDPSRPSRAESLEEVISLPINQPRLAFLPHRTSSWQWPLLTSPHLHLVFPEAYLSHA